MVADNRSSPAIYASNHGCFFGAIGLELSHITVEGRNTGPMKGPNAVPILAGGKNGVKVALFDSIPLNVNCKADQD